MNQLQKEVLIWGIHPLVEVLRTHPEKVREIFILPSFGRKKNQKKLLSLIEKRGAAINRIPDFHRFPMPPRAVHQGICAMTETFWETEAEDIIDTAVRENSSLLVCDQIEDPQNLGAIIRAAAAFNCCGVVIPAKQNAAVNGTVIKASAGAVFHSRICTAVNLANILKASKEHGIDCIGLDARAEESACTADLRPPACLVMGSESRGIRKNIRKMLNRLVRIPINPAIDSLNVSCAAAVALYEIQRQTDC